MGMLGFFNFCFSCCFNKLYEQFKFYMVLLGFKRVFNKMWFACFLEHMEESCLFWFLDLIHVVDAKWSQGAGKDV